MSGKAQGFKLVDRGHRVSEAGRDVVVWGGAEVWERISPVARRATGETSTIFG